MIKTIKNFLWVIVRPSNWKSKMEQNTQPVEQLRSGTILTSTSGISYEHPNYNTPVGDVKPTDPAVMAIVDETLNLLEYLTTRLPRVHSALVGLHALADVWLPGFLASLPSGVLTTAIVVKALLSYLETITVSEPLVHAIIVGARLVIEHLLPRLQTSLLAKGVKI